MLSALTVENEHMANSDVRAALTRMSEVCPEDAAVVREHLDSMIVHPLVLAERAIRASESAASAISNLDSRVGTIERGVTRVLKAEADKLVAEAEIKKVEAAERQAALDRSKESGQWLRNGVANIVGWLGQRSEATVALIIGALGMWFLNWVGLLPFTQQP